MSSENNKKELEENNTDSNLQENNNKELDKCKSDLQNLKDTFLRLNADFENYKKRILKEKSNWVNDAQANLFLDVLNVVDDFDRAFIGYKKGENKELDKWMEGFELIHKSLIKLLEKNSIKEVTDFKIFNPEIHEAISQVESADHKPEQIVSVVQKGYFFKDQLLRPAKVTIAK